MVMCGWFRLQPYSPAVGSVCITKAKPYLDSLMRTLSICMYGNEMLKLSFASANHTRRILVIMNTPKLPCGIMKIISIFFFWGVVNNMENDSLCVFGDLLQLFVLALKFKVFWLFPVI